MYGSVDHQESMKEPCIAIVPCLPLIVSLRVGRWFTLEVSIVVGNQGQPWNKVSTTLNSGCRLIGHICCISWYNLWHFCHGALKKLKENRPFFKAISDRWKAWEGNTTVRNHKNHCRASSLKPQWLYSTRIPHSWISGRGASKNQSVVIWRGDDDEAWTCHPKSKLTFEFFSKMSLNMQGGVGYIFTCIDIMDHGGNL